MIEMYDCSCQALNIFHKNETMKGLDDRYTILIYVLTKLGVNLSGRGGGSDVDGVGAGVIGSSLSQSKLTDGHSRDIRIKCQSTANELSP